MKKNTAFASLGLLLIFTGCISQQRKPKPPRPSPGIKQVLSITPTPRSWDGPGLTESFKEAAKLVTIAAIPDPVEWWHLEGRDPKTSKAYQSAQWQNHLLHQHDMRVFIQVGPRAIYSLPDRTFKEPAIRAAYKADVFQRYELYKPAFMNLGIEINALADRADFPDLVSLIRETAKGIRQQDSSIVLFVSFQYEHLLENDQWKLLDTFSFLDAVGISSYPRKRHSNQFGDPAKLPGDYYTRIIKRTKKPIVFAELGWSADPQFNGGPQSQKEFLVRFFGELLSNMRVSLVNWWFLYDNVGHGVFFDKMGLINSSGVKRPSWQVYSDWSKR